MATNQTYTISNDVWNVYIEWTITAAGAVVPNSDGSTTTEPEVSVVRSGAGTYVVTMRGNFQRVLSAHATYRDATPRSIVANITAISLGGGTPTASGESTTTFTVVTGNSNAVPAAADQAQGVVGIRAQMVKHKV